VPLAEQLRIVRQTFPGQSISGLRLGAADRATTFFAGSRQVMVDGHTGEVTGTRPPGDALRVIHKLHESLLLPGGKILVALSALALLILSASGLVLWWREKRLRIRAGTSRAAFDLHSSMGVFANAYLLVLAVTALFMALPLAPLVFMLTGSKPPDRPQLKSIIVNDAPAITVDRVVALARVALPDLTPEVVLLPRDAAASYRVGMRQGEEDSLAGDIQIDQYSGRVLAADRVDNSDPAMRIVLGMRAFHTGQWLGIPTKILASLSGLVLVAQAITGFLLWRRSRGLRNRAVYRAPAPAAQSSR
jgi:uncharacterized iron-regulated membrane protein